MDFKKHHDKDRDGQECMPPPVGLCCLEPRDQFGHPSRRFERACGFEDDANLIAALIERGDVVGSGLVAAAVPVVLLAVAQQIAMQLKDVVLGDRDVVMGFEHALHDLGIARDLLLIACGKGPDRQIGQQALDLAIGELRALDAGG